MKIFIKNYGHAIIAVITFTLVLAMIFGTANIRGYMGEVANWHDQFENKTAQSNEKSNMEASSGLTKTEMRETTVPGSQMANRNVSEEDYEKGDMEGYMLKVGNTYSISYDNRKGLQLAPFIQSTQASSGISSTSYPDNTTILAVYRTNISSGDKGLNYDESGVNVDIQKYGIIDNGKNRYNVTDQCFDKRANTLRLNEVGCYVIKVAITGQYSKRTTVDVMVNARRDSHHNK